MIRHPPRSTPFPYPPLFRLGVGVEGARRVVDNDEVGTGYERPRRCSPLALAAGQAHAMGVEAGGNPLRHRRYIFRSEEHTSELQSRQYLVFRLLLEKKKNNH